MSDDTTESCARDTGAPAKPKPSQALSSTTVSRPSELKLPQLRSVPAPAREPYRDPNSFGENEVKNPKLRIAPASSGESSKRHKETNPSKPSKPTATLRPPFRSVPLSSKDSKKLSATNNTLQEDKSPIRSTSRAVPTNSPSCQVQSKKEENSTRPVLPSLRSVPAPPRNEVQKTLQEEDGLKDTPNSKSASAKTSGRAPLKQKQKTSNPHQRSRSSLTKNDSKSSTKSKQANSSHDVLPTKPGKQEKHNKVTDPKVAAVLAEVMAAKKTRKPEGAMNSVQLCQNKMLPLPKNDPIARKTAKGKTLKTTKVPPISRSPARNAKSLNETTRRKPLSNPRSHDKSPASKNSGKKVSKTPPRAKPKPRKRTSLSSDESDPECTSRSIRGNKTIQNRKSSAVLPRRSTHEKNARAAQNKKKSFGKVDPYALSAGKDGIDGKSRNRSGSRRFFIDSDDDSNKDLRPSDVRKPVISKSLQKETKKRTSFSHSKDRKNLRTGSADQSGLTRKIEKSEMPGKLKPATTVSTIHPKGSERVLIKNASTVANKPHPIPAVARKKANLSSTDKESDTSSSSTSGSSDEYETASSSDDDHEQGKSDEFPRKSVAGKRLPTNTPPNTTQAHKTVAGKSLRKVAVPRKKANLSSSDEESDTSSSSTSGSSDEYETASSSDDDHEQGKSDEFPRKSVAGKRLPTNTPPNTTQAHKTVAGKSLRKVAVARKKANLSSSDKESYNSSSNTSGSSDEYETASSPDGNGDQHELHSLRSPSMSRTRMKGTESSIGKSSDSQKRSTVRSASQNPKDALAYVVHKHAHYHGTDRERKDSAFVMDERRKELKQYENQRRSIRTKCSKQLSGKNRTAYVDSVRQEFFLEMEYHLYLQRRLGEESNENIRETLLNAMRSFENSMLLRIEGLQLLGAELEQKNYESFKNIFQAKRIALERQVDQTWEENFNCVIDALQEEFSDPSRREMTFTISCDQFSFLKKNWMLLKEVLDLIDRSASELFSIQDEGAGCQLQ